LKKVEKIEENEGDWMASKIETEDFTATVRLYGDDDTMTLEIVLDEEVRASMYLHQKRVLSTVS